MGASLDAAKSGSGGSPSAFKAHNRSAAVEPDRAERVGFGKALERAAPEAAAPPQRLRIRITVSPGLDEPLRIGLGKPFYLAQPETQRPPPP